ncbi:hypothetical protein NDU88_003471 [Pleurodeles waltl]|uniref:Uncharacterized protein n=1 Tax=Pleurodeles waltl TaxID=8319 RepID=A0AAV7VDE6_PLEWA|nr:hypothetical protein NDU88_003471 [Pleurodeles waltl]
MARLSRSKPSTSATKSPGTVVPATAGSSSAPPIRAASVPPCEAKDITPPAKVKKVPTSRREKPHLPATKGSAKTKEDSGKTPAAPSNVGKGQKQKSRPGQGTVALTEGLVSPLLSTTTPTCTAANTATYPATSTATCTATSTATCIATSTTACTATCTSAASAAVPSIFPSGQPSEAAGDVLLCPQQVLTHAPPPAPPPPAPRRALTVAPQLTRLPSPVGSHPRLEETFWTLPSFHDFHHCLHLQVAGEAAAGWGMSLPPWRIMLPVLRQSRGTHTQVREWDRPHCMWSTLVTKSPPEQVENHIHYLSPCQDEALWAQSPLQNQWRITSTTSALGSMKHSGHKASSRTSGESHPLP